MCTVCTRHVFFFSLARCAPRVWLNTAWVPLGKKVHVSSEMGHAICVSETWGFFLFCFFKSWSTPAIVLIQTSLPSSFAFAVLLSGLRCVPFFWLFVFRIQPTPYRFLFHISLLQIILLLLFYLAFLVFYFIMHHFFFILVVICTSFYM